MAEGQKCVEQVVKWLHVRGSCVIDDEVVECGVDREAKCALVVHAYEEIGVE